MFGKILIANRGEIALRVARTCRELGVRTVAVYSTQDRDSAVVRMADEAVHIGPPRAKLSYLNPMAILQAAQQTGAEAIHPGYGFLSEDPDFAEACAAAGITLIGPSAEVMTRLGSKMSARRLMSDAGLPLLPGSLDLERYLDVARHVEIQVLCDAHGTAVHLGARDCSVQRRHQKLIEESPAPRLPDEVVERIGADAVRGARAVGYVGAGTFEFLVGPEGEHHFMEVNCRIQVEHPVTEMVTGIDLVAEQVRVAAGERLSLRQQDIRPQGVAIECRINAEDPRRNFLPTPGTLAEFVPPGGPFVRIDTHAFTGYTVPPSYDSLLAKLIVWAPDRPAAIRRMHRALEEFRIAGERVATTKDFLREVLDEPTFASARHSTALVDQMSRG
jgi:acetyl-CoA carboxylase biotin carboxylase subunit